MTKKEMFAMAINVIAETNAPEKDFLIAGLQHEIELLSRKSSGSRKPTATQVANQGFKADILVALGEADAPVSIKELYGICPSLEGLTNQRVTHLLTDLRKDGKVARTYVKKVAYFALGSEAEGE